MVKSESIRLPYGGPAIASAPHALPTLDDLFRDHAGFVFRILRRYGVPDAVLDDKVQDVFLVAHRRFSSYDPQTSARSWLLGIARRVASHERRGRKRAERRLDRVPRPVGTDTPEHTLADREAAELVRQFLEKLDEKKRMIFVLSDLEGLSAPEIASALEMNVNTVYSCIRTARQRFEREVDRRLAKDRATGKRRAHASPQ